MPHSSRRKNMLSSPTTARLAERGLARTYSPPQTILTIQNKAGNLGKRRLCVSLTARPRQTRLGNICPTGGEETFCGHSSSPSKTLFLPPSIFMVTSSLPTSLEDQVAMATSKPPAPSRQGSSPLAHLDSWRALVDNLNLREE